KKANVQMTINKTYTEMSINRTNLERPPRPEIEIRPFIAAIIDTTSNPEKTMPSHYKELYQKFHYKHGTGLNTAERLIADRIIDEYKLDKKKKNKVQTSLNNSKSEVNRNKTNNEMSISKNKKKKNINRTNLDSS